jgi:urease accessory protein
MAVMLHMRIITTTTMSITNIKSLTQNEQADSIAQFRLWQLISPALPIGGYAYSQGLEYAVESGWVSNEQDMQQWIAGMLRNIHQQLDLPVLARIYRAWCADDVATVQYWNDYLLAARETSELLQEDRQLGRALAVLLRDLECKNLAVLNKDELSLATALAAAGVGWAIPVNMLAQAYLWIWVENQIAAAIKLIPLGQTAGQRILYAVSALFAGVVTQALAVDDDNIGQSAMALAIASARHETQHTRIFRS